MFKLDTTWKKTNNWFSTPWQPWWLYQSRTFPWSTNWPCWLDCCRISAVFSSTLCEMCFLSVSVVSRSLRERESVCVGRGGGGGEIGAGMGGGGAQRERKKRRCVLCFSVVIILNTLHYDYVPVLNYWNMFMFYNGYFICCFTSTCFIFV